MTENAKFAIMEQKDEQQILAELQGVYLDKFVYSFKQGNQDVTGISWAGIKEIAYRIGEIDTTIEKFEETEDAYVFIVKATNKGVGSRLGVSNQPKKYSNGKPDQFALQKALSKAQRNAIRGVIPEATIQQYLDKFMKQDKNVDNSQPEEPRYEPNQDDGSSVFDLASLNSFLSCRWGCFDSCWNYCSSLCLLNYRLGFLTSRDRDKNRSNQACRNNCPKDFS